MSTSTMPGTSGFGLMGPVAGQPGSEVELVGFTGDLDLATISAFTEALEPALAAGRSAVVVDLCGTLFMDSTGVAALMAARRRLAREDRPFALACSPGGAVYKLLALVGLTDALSVHPSRESAVDAATGGCEMASQL